MSCCICFSDPPNAPVSTIDGQIYCLECITEWFEKGNGKSPASGVQIPKILIPAVVFCQNLNIPITQIPEKYTYKINSNNGLQQQHDNLQQRYNNLQNRIRNIEEQSLINDIEFDREIEEFDRQAEQRRIDSENRLGERRQRQQEIDRIFQERMRQIEQDRIELINRTRQEQIEREQERERQRLEREERKRRERQELIESIHNLIPDYLRDTFPKYKDINNLHEILNYKKYISCIVNFYNYMETNFNIKPEELIKRKRFFNYKFGEINNPNATLENGKIFQYPTKDNKLPIGLKYLYKIKEINFINEAKYVLYYYDKIFLEYWNQQIAFYEVICNKDFIKNELIQMKLIDENSKYTRFNLQKFTNYELVRILKSCTENNIPDSIVRREMIDQILNKNSNFDLNVWYEMYSNL